jgi:hypothetical protein
LFKITQSTGQVLYGNYIYAFAENENDFDIEIGLFGYVDPYATGDLHPAYRQHFTAEESSAAERLIRSYFLSNSFDHGFLPPARFLGGVSFRPNWIVQKSPEGTA